MIETEQSISEWAAEAFGEPANNLSIACRANEEMAELLKCLSDNDADPRAAIEAADVIITLMRLFGRLDTSLQECLDYKMKVNRGRTWQRDGRGHGYHL